jgi:repressor LexA
VRREAAVTKHAETRYEVLEAIREYVKTQGIPPTLAELAEMLNIASTSTIRHHLLNLESEGLVKRVKGVARGIIIVEHD